MFLLYKTYHGLLSEEAFQKFYDECVEEFRNSKEFVCPICREKLYVHDQARRMIHLKWQKITIRIQRVRCARCGSTHRILLGQYLPYHLFCVKDAEKALFYRQENRPFQADDFDFEGSLSSIYRFVGSYGNLIQLDENGKIRSFDFLERGEYRKVIVVYLDESSEKDDQEGKGLL